MGKRAGQQKPQSSTGAKPRTLKRQSSKTLVEQQAMSENKNKIKTLSHKCLRETFVDLDDQEKCHILDPETGLNLTDRVKQDKTWAYDHDPRAPKFGKIWSDKLRQVYQRASDEDGAAALDIADDAVKCSPTLFAAVDESRLQIPKRDKLISFLQQMADGPNQTEVVGLFLHALELKPHLGVSHFAVLDSLLGFCDQFHTDRKFTAEWAVFRPQADKTLCAAFVFMKNKGVLPQLFWEKYRQKATMVCDVALVDQLLAVKGDWLEHDQTVQLVVNGSALGRKTFQFAADTNIIHSVGKLIVQELNEAVPLTGDGKVVPASFDAVKAKIMNKYPASVTDILEHSREIKLTFHGMSILRQVSSLWSEMTLRFDCHKKALGLRHCKEGTPGVPLIPFVFCEKDLSTLNGALVPRQIHASILEPFVTARKSANQQLASTRHTSASSIQGLLFFDTV